jgi:hypothetical protein
MKTSVKAKAKGETRTAELIKDIALEDLLPNPYQPASQLCLKRLDC